MNFEDELRELVPGRVRQDFVTSASAQAPGVNVQFHLDSRRLTSMRITFSVVYDAVARPLAAVYRDGGHRLVTVRPMNIELRAEDASDIAAKERGLSVEWQSGDPELDRAVYIVTQTPAEILGHVLGSEATRAAVIELIALGFGAIAIDNVNGRVEATMERAKFEAAEPRRDRAIATFQRLVSQLPQLQASGKKHLVLRSRVGRPRSQSSASSAGE